MTENSGFIPSETNVSSPAGHTPQVHNSPSHSASETPDAERLLRVAAPLLAALGLLVWLYAPTLQQLWISWRTDEYYSHGPLVPLVSLLLIWNSRDRLKEAWNARWQQRGWPVGWKSGLALLLVGLAVMFAGMLTDINFVRAASLPLVLLGAVRMLGGAAFSAPLVFPILLLLTTVPLSRVFVQTLSVPLQNLGAGCAAMVLGLGGLQVENEGVNIFTPQYSFVVDVPCSGLKTSIAMFTIAIVVAHAMPELTTWRRYLLAATGVPIAILTNVVRIVMIILIGIYMGPEAAEGFLHSLSNVVTLGLALVLLLGVGRLLLPDEEEIEEAAPTQAQASRAAITLPQPRAWMSGIGAIALLLLATQVAGSRALIVEDTSKQGRVEKLELPTKSGVWSGKPQKVDTAVYEMLRPDVATQVQYSRPGEGKRPVQIQAIAIHSRDARGFHAPEVCLRSSGWTVSSKETRTVSDGQRSMDFTMVKAERQHDGRVRGRTQIAYIFAESRASTSGWLAMLARQAMGRAMDRSVGATEVQFAFGPDSLTPDGKFSPEMVQLMLDATDSINHQIATARRES